MQDREIINLLIEIRDTQREHLGEYRKVAQQALAIQTEARNRHQQLTKLYFGVVAVGGALFILVVIVLLYYAVLHW